MISIVIPFYNERESLPILYGEIVEATRAAGIAYEVWFVDDGSKDGSWQIVKDLAKDDQRVHGIRFRTNFGKAAALSAGFRSCRGDIILTLDADLQDDPKEIPRFLQRLNEGLDVVSGWKKVRLDPWHKVWPSRVFNGLVSWVMGVPLHDHNCGMKAYRAEVFREIRLYGELHRFIPCLTAARGYRVGELAINHRARQYGVGKYMGVGRFVKGLLDLMTVKFLTGFGQRPQHILGSIGLLSFALGSIGMLWLAFTWMITQIGLAGFEPLHQRPALIYSAVALLLGAQMMSIGLLAEMITAYQSRDEESYSVAEEIGVRGSNTALKKDNPASGVA